MKVASMKPIDDGAGGSEGRGDLTLVLPLAGQCPLIQFEIGRRFVDLRLVLIEATGRGEVFSSVVADVCLRGLDIAGIGCCFSARCGDLSRTAGERLMIRLFEE